MRSRRRTPRRREAPRWTPADWAAATITLLARSGGLCEKCGRPLVGRAERHHRKRRQQGGDRLSNLLLLHPECHQWITEHPEDSRDVFGWIIPTWIEDTSRAPVLIGGLWWLLDDEGGRTRTDPPGDYAWGPAAD